MSALLALFFRSLRDDTRSKALLWTRIGLAVAVVFIIWKARVTGSASAAGLDVFETLVWINFVFIAVAGVSYFATAITEEKEDATLGLLRMTDLSPFAILLGKSTSRFIGGALMLLVQLPFALLAVTLGGLHWSQVASAYALLAAFLFFACNVGLLGSVLARRTGGAAVCSALLGGLWIAWMWLGAMIGFLVLGDDDFSGSGADAFLRTCHNNQFTPYALNEVLGSGYATFSIRNHILWLLGGGVLAFYFSRSLFESCCGEESTPRKARGIGGALRRFSRGTPGRAWRDAIAWRDFHFIHGGMRVVWLKVAIYFGAAAIYWWEQSHVVNYNRFRTWEFYGVGFFWSLLVIICESAFAASRIFRLERKDKTLSSIFILPQDLPALIHAKRRAVLRSLIPAFVGTAVFGCVVLGLFLEAMGENRNNGKGEFMFYFVQAIALIIAQIFLNLRLVAWFSLRMKWGGLPVALALSWVAHMIIGFFTVLIFREASIFLLLIAIIFAAVGMKRALHYRLELAAAEE